MRFEVLLLVPVDCVATMLDTINVFGLFVAILTTLLFGVAEPCSVLYACKCNGLSLTKSVGNCESLAGGHRTYINCSSTCIIPSQAFKDLPCKKCMDTLYLEYYNISDIQPDAFTDLKDLSGLYLNNNDIQELHQNTFKDLLSLMKLDVSFNRLRYIHPKAFVHMNKFYDLNISHNFLVMNGTILYSDINILDAAFCNPAKDASWYVLKHSFFSGLPNLTTLVLEGNAIQCVMWDTFSNNRRLTSLNLRNNMLKFMPHEITFCYRSIQLDLSNNPLDCNCHMKKYTASCPDNTVVLDEVSCGTPLGLEDLSCDQWDTGICGFDTGSTFAVTSTLSWSEGTTQDDTTSAVFSTTSETLISSMYSDQHSPTSADQHSPISTDQHSPTSADQQSPISADKHSLNSSRYASKQIAQLMELSSTPTAEISSTFSQDPSVAFTKEKLSESSMLIVFGVVVILVVIIAVVAVYVILRVCRRQDVDGSVPATHYFNFHFVSRNPETKNKVDGTYKTFRYISLGRIQKAITPKQDLHYSCRDVTTLHGMSAQGQPENGSYNCSVTPQTNKATGYKYGDLEEHVYEEVI